MSADRTPLKHSVVRILAPGGTFTGLGYRVSEDAVLTCAHVIADALPIDPWEPQAPTEEVLVDVPFTVGERSQVKARVVPEGWMPLRKDIAISDLAVLRLTAPLPGQGISAQLDHGISLTGHSFLSYGGSQGHEQYLAPLEGRVGFDIGNGRYYLSASGSDYPIEPGCSGAPVLSAQNSTVLGIIAQDEQDPNIRGGFLIPASHLRQILAQAGIESRAFPDLEFLRTWINEHLRGAGFRLADQVSRFVDYYAGALNRPMPFVGRDEAISNLDGWLAAGGGSFRLLTGAAGLGKSALLLHWMARLLGRDQAVNVLFLPVSIRFDIADEMRGLRLLHAQLAGLFGELLFPEGAKPHHEDYRDRISAGWEGIANRPEMRFLLVIDGADEASGDWAKKGLLPYSIPPNLAIVLAARYKPGRQDGHDWLDEFVFAPKCIQSESLDLQSLSKEAVGEAIAQLGHPLDVLPEREGILDELYRLTDYGDPLLINLWVGQLWREREQAPALRAADLQKLEPSFDGFLKDAWIPEQQAIWKDQRLDVHPDDFRKLLRILALARGPLKLKDLLALVDQLSFPKHWDFEHTRRVLDSAFRLVVPVMDDIGRKGYAFVHPRLGDHFRTELETIKEERRSVPRAYLDWGAATVAALNEDTLFPEQCPPYLLRHYVAHVLAAELVPDEALHRYLVPLLGRGWHQAWHQEEGAYGSYLGDVHRVQDRLHEANLDSRGTAHHLGQELRCWLIRASIFSLTENIPPELIMALVEEGEWSGQRALRVASQFANPVARVETYGGLAKHLQGEARQQCLQQALAAAAAIGDEEERTRALSGVAGQLQGEPALLQQALAAASAIGDEGSRGEALSAVAGQLRGEPALLQQALAAAVAIGDEEERTRALSGVAGQLQGEPALLQQALEVASAIGDEGSRGEALSAVAGQLRGEPALLQQALAAAVAIGDEEERTRALSGVAGQLQGEPALLQQALEVASAIGDEEERAEALSAVAGQLQGEPALLQQARAAAGIGDEGSRANALAAMAGQLQGEACQQCLRQALAVAAAIDDEWSRAEALSAVAGQLQGEPALLCQAQEAAAGIGDEGSRANALAAVAGQLQGEARQQCLRRALAAAAAIGDEWSRAEALSAVAGQLQGEPALLCQAQEAAAGIGDEGSRANALAAVAGQLQGEARQQCLRQAVEAAAAIGDEWIRAGALSGVAGRLQGEPALLRQALEAASAIGDEGYRAGALSAVAGQLQGEARQQCLRQALAAAAAIGDEEERTRALSAVAGQLRGEPALLKQALAAAVAIGDEEERAEALSAVAGQLQGEPALLQQALEAASAIGYEWIRAGALSGVAGRLQGEPALLRQALEAAAGIGDEGSRANALVAVAGQLKGEPALLQQAMEVASAIGDEEERAIALSAVAGQLQGEVRQQCLRQALEAAAIGYAWSRARALSAVAGQLQGEPALLRQALEAAAAIGDEKERARALSAVAGQLQGDARQQCLRQALEAAAGIGDEGSRANALAAVAGQLQGEPALLRQALEAASAIGDEGNRAIALSAVAGQLQGEARQQCLRRALAAAAAIGDEWSRAEALSAVAGQLQGEPALWKRMLREAEQFEKSDRLEVLSVLAQAWNPSFSHANLVQMLNTMGISGRGDWLKLVEALAPIILKLGGTTAVEETADAILDVAYWWP